MQIPDEYKKPMFELGRFTATLAALILALSQLGVAKKEDVTAAKDEINKELKLLDKRMMEARYRIDQVATIYQMREGVMIFTWRNLEPPETANIVDPVGPVMEPNADY